MRIAKFVLAVIFTFGAALASTGGSGALLAQHAAPDSTVPTSLLEQIREATRQFADVERAKDAQYGELPGCVTGPQEGAMGVHYVNMGLVGDGELDVNQPEALIYEPNNGQLRLVGVEYLVTVADWQSHHPQAGPGAPVLAGQMLQFVDSPNRFGLPPFFELHVWAWQHNPHGSFVDWNTLVKCDH
jgi:hypothetical protein